MAGSVCLFSALMSAIESTKAELMEAMEVSQKAAEQQANTMLSKLEQENVVLQRRLSDLDELAQSDDYTHCIKVSEASVRRLLDQTTCKTNLYPFQTLPSLILTPPVQDWSAVSISSYLGTSNIYRKLAVQMERFNEELKTVTEKG